MAGNLACSIAAAAVQSGSLPPFPLKLNAPPRFPSSLQSDVRLAPETDREIEDFCKRVGREINGPSAHSLYPREGIEGSNYTSPTDCGIGRSQKEDEPLKDLLRPRTVIRLLRNISFPPPPPPKSPQERLKPIVPTQLLPYCPEPAYRYPRQ